MAYFNKIFSSFFDDTFFFERLHKNYMKSCFISFNNVLFIKPFSSLSYKESNTNLDTIYLSFINEHFIIDDQLVFILPRALIKYEYFY